MKFAAGIDLLVDEGDCLACKGQQLVIKRYVLLNDQKYEKSLKGKCPL